MLCYDILLKLVLVQLQTTQNLYTWQDPEPKLYLLCLKAHM